MPTTASSTRSPTRQASRSGPGPSTTSEPRSSTSGPGTAGALRPRRRRGRAARGRPGTAVLAGWRLLLDAGRGQDGERFLAGTAKRPVARLSAATAAAADLFEGDVVRVSTDRGSIELPVVVTDMVEHVVWLPAAPWGRGSTATSGGTGALVRIEPAAGGPDSVPSTTGSTESSDRGAS
ncbi:molybdopterin dinucleotide binding domain-containing protein [Oerskovia sp. M15]